MTDVLAAVATIGGRVVGQVIEGQARYPLQIDRKTLYRKLEEPEPAEQLPPSNKAD
jgi:Cu/Ag efflux pump CusA